MLTIRLTRKGKKNQPFFRVVLIDKRRSSKGGRAVEVLGYVDPLTKRKSFEKDRILHWIKMGAQPSATIHNLLVAEKIVDAPKIKKFNISKKAKAEAEKAKVAASPAEAPKSEGAAAETPVEGAKPAASAEGSGEAKPATAESSGEAKPAAETPAAETPATPAAAAPAEEAGTPKPETETPPAV